MAENGITLNGIFHKIVKSETYPKVFYCNDCSLRDLCLIKYHPCHLFGVGIGWHFEVDKST